MEIKKPKIEIKELSSIRVLSDDGIDSSEMDNVVGGHGYHGHHGCYGYNKYYDFIDKYVQDYIKDYFGKGKDTKKEDSKPEYAEYNKNGITRWR